MLHAAKLVTSAEGTVVIESANARRAGKLAVTEFAPILCNTQIAVAVPAIIFDAELAVAASAIIYAQFAICMAATFDTHSLTIVTLDALRLVAIAMTAPFRLEAGKMLAATATLNLRFVAASPIDARDALLFTASPFHACCALLATTALNLRLALTTAAALGLRLCFTAALYLTVASAALGLGLCLTAALGLRMTALIGLRCCGCCNCHCCDTCCQDELPHRKISYAFR